ncbi:MAG: small-conductance mechanosensitive channel [Bryobacterales bacterium]|nr:small-conductance mechanosensitive channel [Bryobacterales bacterium]
MRRPITIRLCVPHAFIALAIVVQCTLVGDGVPASSNNFPSKQKVLAFLVETIDWYRRLSVEQQIATEPTDMLFLEDNRPISVQVVRFSFEFARAAVAFEATASSAADPKAPRDPASGPDFRHLAEMEAKSEAEAQQAGNDLKSLNQKRLAARGAERNKLEVEIADTQSRLNLLQAISATSRNLLDFMRATDAGHTQTSDLEASVDALERTVPEASSSASSPPPTASSHSSSSAAVLQHAPSGIVGQISNVATLARKQRSLNEGMQLTDKLIQSSQNLQTPLADAFNETFRSTDLSTGTFKSNDTVTLRKQEARLNALTAETTRISPAIAALAKQRVLLNLYKSNLGAWRTAVVTQYRAAWETLLIRLGILAVVLAVLIGAAGVSRRLTSHHVHDFNRRRMLLFGQRILFWLTIVLTVSFSFAFDVSSLATFLGLASAGIAVALQNVILAVVGYFVLVGKLRMRVGDRVQISGVTGEVVDIGLMQFQIKEINGSSEQPTGRVVSFSNSFVFVSPATGLFKRIRG